MLTRLSSCCRWWDDSRGDEGHPWWHLAKHLGDMDSIADLQGLDDDGGGGGGGGYAHANAYAYDASGTAAEYDDVWNATASVARLVVGKGGGGKGGGGKGGGGKGKGGGGGGGGGGWPGHHTIHVHHLTPPSQSPRILLYCVFISGFGLLILLLALRRLNRFERQSFVNSYVLWNKVSSQSVQMRGKQVERPPPPS